MQSTENIGALLRGFVFGFIKIGLLSEPTDRMFLARLADQQTPNILHLSPSPPTSVGYKYIAITNFGD